MLTGRRHLFSSELLGIENYKRLKTEFTERIGPVKGRFKFTCISVDCVFSAVTLQTDLQ